MAVPQTLGEVFEAAGLERRIRPAIWAPFRDRPLDETLRRAEFWSLAVETELIPPPFLSALLADPEARSAAAAGIILRLPAPA